MRVLLYVQHLLGSGHLKRTALIAEALNALGADVHLISGGMPVSVVETGDFTVHQLEPVRAADATFSTLIDASGEPVGADLLGRRESALVELVDNLKPDVVIIESWPFGRRKLRGELTALCETLHQRPSRPVIACSIRDILQRGRKPKRIVETAEHIERWFDYVLVHSDEDFVTLDASFDETARFEDKIVYTGFVSRPGASTPRWSGSESQEVLVSAGGGAAGAQLYELCIATARTIGDRITWRLLIGEALDPAVGQRLHASAPAWVTVEAARADFPQLLSGCGLSISQAGYNTTMDLVGCGCPAIVVPFALHGETEQLDRAGRLDDLGIARSVSMVGLSPEIFAEQILEALGNTPDAGLEFRTDGATWTAKWVLDLPDSPNMA